MTERKLTHRGFVIYDEIADMYGGVVRVAAPHLSADQAAHALFQQLRVMLPEEYARTEVTQP